MLTEKTFSLNGLGKYAYDGIVNNDLPKILGVTLVAGFFVIMANLFVDLLYGVIDPAGAARMTTSPRATCANERRTGGRRV